MPTQNYAEAAVVGSHPSTSGPPAPTILAAPFHQSSAHMVPLQVPGHQGAPLVYHTAQEIAHAARGVPTANGGGAIFTVYVPAHAAPPSAVNMVPQPQPAMTVLPTATAPPKVYAVPAEPPQRSTVAPTSSDDETAATTKQGNRSAAGSFDSQHEVAHSVLLLASGVRDSNSKRKSPPDSPTTDEDGATKVPFKKRKLVSEILRTKDGQGTIHVSPVSHGSKTAGTTLSPDRSHTSQGSSYEEEIKGGQALPDSAKITEDKTIVVAPPQTVTAVVRHFPSKLFDLLSSPSADVEGVLQWTTDGKAWRIVRWDALRKSVLPKHFGGATVDSFLSEISSWGFAEITFGTDAGAYSHTLFRRGFPNLCKEIQQTVARPEKATRRNSALSILKVPSLGDAAQNEASSVSTQKTPSSPSTVESVKPSKDSPVPVTANTTPQAATAWPFHGQPVYIPYRQEDHFFAAGGEIAHAQQPAPQGWIQAVPAADASVPSLPAYSPVRVRSGRGAARVPAHVPVQITPNPRRTVQRPNFARVVSNRGRRSGSGMVASASMVSQASSTTLSSLPTMPTTPLVPSPLRSALKQQTESAAPAIQASDKESAAPDSPASESSQSQQQPPSPPTLEKRASPVASTSSLST